MNFLWPGAWLLSALALPVIALYLIRNRLERKPVSTSLFWQHLTPQVYNHSLWRKLRRWISLALQLLFLLLLIAAISRPMAAWQSTKPASVVLLLDASVSMTATDVQPSRWAEAVRQMQRRIDQLRLFDEATLILSGEAPRVLCQWTRNRRALSRALKTAAPVASAGDIRPALALAHSLGDQRSNTEIVLISDGVWKLPPGDQALKGVQAQWIGAPAPSNAGFTLFTVRRSPAAPGDYQLLARVTASTPVTAQLELRKNGVLMDVQPLKLAPGKPWQKTWEGTSTESVRFDAQITGIPHDDLAADNHAQATLAGLQEITAEVVSKPNPFLDAALESIPLVKVHYTWPPETLRSLGTAADAPHTLYIFNGTVPPADFHAPAMLVMNPESDGFWGHLNGLVDAAMVSDVDRDQPIMRFVSLDSVRLPKARDITPAPGSRIYASSFGKPLIFGQWTHSPRWLAVAFGLEDSDLVFRTAFPIFLGNLVQSLQPDEAKTEALPGPVATQLKPTGIPHPKTPGASLAVRNAWWTTFPIWWWALTAGLGWLLLEWWTYSRRITE